MAEYRWQLEGYEEFSEWKEKLNKGLWEGYVKQDVSRDPVAGLMHLWAVECERGLSSKVMPLTFALCFSVPQFLLQEWV